MATKKVKKQKEVKKQEETKEMALPNIIEPEIISETDVEILDLRSKVLKLAEEIKERYYELSIILSDVYHSKLFEQWGFKTIKEYFENEVGMSYRSGMYYVEMGDAIKKFSIGKEAIKGLGWSKFKELAKLVNNTTPEEFQQIVDKAKELPVKEVENIVKQKKQNITEERTILSFTLLKEQAETVEHAIAIASELLGIPVGEQRGRCLEYICLEFQSNYNPELTEHIKSLMASEEKLKKAEYKERADKGKKKKNTKKEEVA